MKSFITVNPNVYSFLKEVLFTNQTLMSTLNALKKEDYPFNWPSFTQKFSKPKPIIDELSAWSWKAPPRRVFENRLEFLAN